MTDATDLPDRPRTAAPARLTGALLARKGEAAPSAGLRSFGRRAEPPAPLADLAEPAERVQPAPAKAKRARPGRKDKLAMTLRLDHEHHQRLRLLSVAEHKSCQELLVEALDAMLARRR